MSILAQELEDYSQQLMKSKLQSIATAFSQSNKPSQIKSIITNMIAIQKQPYLYQLLKFLGTLFENISPNVIKKILNDLETSLGKIQRFETFLVFIKYILVYQSQMSSYRLMENFNSLAIKSGFFSKDILILQKDTLNMEANKGYHKLVQAIKIGVEYLPKLYQVTNRVMDPAYLTNLIDWILLFQTKTKEDYRVLNTYCKFIVKQCLQTKYKLDLPNYKAAKKLLQLVIQKSVKKFNGCSNLSNILEVIQDQNIFSILISQYPSFAGYTPEVYLECFQVLSKGGLGIQTLRFMIAISFSLRQQYKFNILKLLYQEFIIPKIVRFCKLCKLQQKQIKRLVSFYVLGFMDRIQIGSDKIVYFLSNYQMLSKKQMQFWFKMTALLTYQNQTLQKVIEPLLIQITSFKSIHQVMSQQEYYSRKKDMWIFLQKDLKQRKKYKYYHSQFTGIKNQNVNCYIISVMQALYMSASLPKILKKHQNSFISHSIFRSSNQFPLLNSITNLFSRLQMRSRYVTIDDVKNTGPQSFKYNQQQDCQHYLSQVLEHIQKQIKKISDKPAQLQILQKFKNTFEIIIKTEISCTICKSKIRNKDQKTYNLSIDYKEQLLEQWETTVEDYQCDDCKWKGNHVMKSKIVKSPEILFVLIKRFHFDKKLGEVKKLEEANIIRKFKDYQLEGFICHIGIKVLCGHYTLYYRKPTDPLRWIFFDDREVSQLKIDEEDECFESNLKSENTPYICIYKRTKRK